MIGTASTSGSNKLTLGLFFSVIGIVTFLIYWPVTSCDFINYDDPVYFTVNPHVLAGLTVKNVAWAFTSSEAFNWHPLTWLSLMLDVSLFGKKAAGVHFVNLLFHVANAILLFWLLWRLTSSIWRCAVVAALFAWHPTHVESVAWVAERKDVLSTFFGFLALLFYVSYALRSEASRRATAPKPTESRISWLGSPFYWAACFCFSLGLMSKPMLVTWPFVLLLLDYWPLNRWKTGHIGWLLGEKAPFVVLAVAASCVTFFVQKHTGAVAPVAVLPLDMRAGNAVVSYCRYLGKLFWPTDLAVFYPHPGYWPIEIVLLAIALLGATSMFLFIQRRRYPMLLMGWLWFCVTLVPVIGLLQVGSQAMADRYAYIPSVGVFIMTVWGICELSNDWRFKVPLLSLMTAGSLVGCLVLTWYQVGYWQNSETLFRHAISVTKDNYIAYNNLGIALAGSGQAAAAEEEFRHAVQICPTYAEGHYNFGRSLLELGQTDAAISEFHEALRLKPDYGLAHYSLGSALGRQNRTDEAISEFQAAIRLVPDYEPSYFNLGVALSKQGRTDEAISELRVALRLQPNKANTHNKLGNLFVNQGQIQAAITEYQTAIQLKPDYAEAHSNLGSALAGEGQTDSAVSEFTEAVRLSPNEASFHDNLGVALASKGQTDAAISEFQQSLQLVPTDAEAGGDLGYLYVAQGTNLDEAKTLIEMAVKSDPANSDFLGSLGWVFLKLNQPARGLDYLLKAVANAHPPEAELYDHLGDTYAALNRRDQAATAWRKSLALKPDPQVRKKLAGSSPP